MDKSHNAHVKPSTGVEPPPVHHRTPHAKSHGFLKPPYSLKKKLLLGLLFGVPLFLIAVVFINFFFSKMRHAEPTETAIRLVQQNAEVTRLIGRPIEAGSYVSGHINLENGGVGEAELHIPVTGPSGSGTVYALEYRRDGKWVPDELSFQPDSRSAKERICLVAPCTH